MNIETIREVINIYERLKKISKALHRYDERHSERDLTEREKDKVKKLIEEAQKLAEKINCKIYHQTDPRGATLYLGDEQINGTNYYKYIPII